ncbi:alpha-L-fucosidase [Elizabethkingia anophelis]|uniref:alpha-L-fucosidase n=1 Tax=Elizabethkingia anophelis R26 TaxID=1246994 RepID=A0ABN5BPK4_9FLAO|nr:alpha-L-fucosidase [Elizabethkingia anophelis]ATC35732.1 alpha-1,3/4-fucosidase [Elizabethkingia anophelis R26]ATC39371.1 alpha-1,3/4-fucosidase [Elizabethkingia anophelis Ag1]ATC43050.1 alpha-1,3/4-fucosidase [Elizabethkingia anophelis]ATC46726.1 alpha-1,3/4-fucosidase [Elizabethkingia anophelis]ELR79422.1 alpha-1,3/4-fucosidase [Elizabethkingia anophelis R26]
MKLKTCITSLALLEGLVCISAQNAKIIPANTIAIAPTDSKELIIEKAAHVIPTKKQLDALRNEFIAFIHFGPNTFTRMEWGSGMEDPKIFDLKELDTDQWCKSLKGAGMKMVILTVKHHDGFVLWQSRYTDHGIMSTNFRNGKGDILRDLSKSCQKYGLKLGLYLSPADLYQIENPKGLYGNLSQYTKRTIPREVPGRPFSNKTKFEFEVDDYNEYFLNQLFEILTEYGPIHEVWFDGAHPKTKGGQKYNYEAWKKLIHTLAPRAVIFGQGDVRWCGNEAGVTRKTEWNVLPFNNKDLTEITGLTDWEEDNIGRRDRLYNGHFLHYQQAEVDTSIREGWFYRDDVYQKVRSADDVFDIYERSVGGNSTFILNVPPNRDGKFSDQDVKVLSETGKRIKETYSKDLLQGAKGPKQVLDHNDVTYSLLNNNQLIIETPTPVIFNRIMLQEAVSTHGERVESHAVDAWIDGEWKEIATATNIGYKRILRFSEVTTRKIRLRVLQDRGSVAISRIAAYYYKMRPPQLTILQDKTGKVSIDEKKQPFDWKNQDKKDVKDKDKDFNIYYTTDGSEPGINSLKYNGPFEKEQGTIKAVAILKGDRGAVQTEVVGIAKNKWKLAESKEGTKNHSAEAAFDANPKTFWQSENQNVPQNLSLDLGALYTLTGMAYTPQTAFGGGMMAKGIVEISADGKKWEAISAFEFGNLVNDPSKRSLYFKQAVKARYVRVTAQEITGNSQALTIAELDFF